MKPGLALLQTPPDAAPVDLSACAREPIHISGAVQPQGCLLAFDLSTWHATHVSANAAATLDLPADAALLGAPAETLIDPAVLHDIRNTLQGSIISGSAERLVDVVVRAGRPCMDVAVHAAGDLAVIELTPHAGADTATTDPIVLVKSMMGRLKRAPNLERFLLMAARQVRSVTGYDRVMVYKFLPDDSGEVVAEAIRSGLTPYQGLRYPASDIPPQARLLYRRQWLRMITDVAYRPVPLISDATAPLDLSLATLRSVSPVHLEYLRNMGSAATLTVSLMAGDRLWGLIACHHEVPRRIGASTCAATEMFGQILSLQIEAREAEEERAQAGTLRAAQDALLAAMPVESTLFDDLPRFAPALAKMLPCDGIGVWTDGRFVGTGQVPPPHIMPGLVAWLDGTGSDEVIVTERLAREYPLAATFADRVAGMVAVRFSRRAQDYLFFFREETIRTVVWGGNPNKPAEVTDGGTRIGPRRSFEAWREQVRGECRRWHPAEVQIVRVLRVSLLDVILRRSDLLNRERKAAQESQSLLIAELNHRVKNVLALIRSLVRQSRQEAQSVEGFAQDLEHRIRALAFAHDQLMQVGWRGAPLRRLLEAEIEAWARTAGDRVRLEGPSVTLGSRAYQSLALVFHEMMTNAAKYGALSTPGGQLVVCWTLDDEALKIAWTEAGGPPVSPPTRRGFGSVIVDQTIPFELQGESRVHYAASGVEARFVVPATHLVADGEVAQPPTASRPTPAPVADLAGKRLLLVEDSIMIALDAQLMLSEAGLDVEIAGNVADASRALQVNTFDMAVLDVNLSGETSFPLADALTAMTVPFVFATGYGESTIIPERFAAVTVVAKPYDERGLCEALAVGMAQRRGGPS